MNALIFVGKITSLGKRGFAIHIPEEVQSKYPEIIDRLKGKPVVVEVKELAGAVRGVMR